MKMDKKDVIVEIGCEDLPSWSGSYLKENWLPVLTSLLAENRVEHGTINFFHTSRRLILFVRDVAGLQKDLTSEVYGPPLSASIDKDGNYTFTAEKFAESQGIQTKDLIIKEKKGRKVLVAVKKEKGEKISRILGKILIESLKKTEIPRAMRWNSGGFSFIRPIRWIVALFGEKVVKMEIDGVKSSRFSYGHRVLAPGRFSVYSPHDYLDKSLKKFIIFDPEVRFEFIKASILKKFDDLSFDEEFVRYISTLVEYPFIEVCSLKDEHMNLPDEVISAVIKKLNAIPLTEKNGKLHFSYIAVFDGRGGDEVRSNYQSVLHARMADARFFMEKDMQVDFASYTEQLKNIMYNPRWGSIYDRIERFKKIGNILIGYMDINDEEKQNISLIISLCKNDLPTLMVAEFPSLEGVIGRIYAEKNNYNRVVSSGIEEHYLPRYSGDRLPGTREARIVSMVVRLETICGLLIENVKVSGAGDPYGLKKITNGFIEIVWKEKKEFPLKDVIKKTVNVFDSNAPADTTEKIMDFILQRAENLLALEGITPGIRKSVISIHRENLVMVREKIDALKAFFKKSKGAKSILVPFIRVANILKQAEERGLKPQVFDETLLKENTEKEVYEFYRAEETIKKLCEEKKYEEFLQHLSRWKGLIDRYFDDILIMCPDEKLRDNRLALLRKVNELFNLFADFSQIPIVEVDNNIKRR